MKWPQLSSHWLARSSTPRPFCPRRPFSADAASRSPFEPPHRAPSPQQQQQRAVVPSLPSPSYEITLLRHGQCETDAKNAFASWHDSKLTALGVEQAKRAGALLDHEGLNLYHIVYTSELDRAQRTVHLLLDSFFVQPRVFATWRLNERHLGDLSGHNRVQMALVHGAKEVEKWTTDDYEACPVPIQRENPVFDDILETFRGKKLEGKVPESESQRDVDLRVGKYWHNIVVPALKMHNKVLIVAHEASLRAVIGQFAQLSEAQVMSLQIPRAVPLIFALNNDVEIMKSKKGLVFGSKLCHNKKSLKN